MEELLEKAEKISGIHYDIESYSDIVKAIHVVQQEMGITGTTAAEAADTIQGSAGSMKAAWENLKVELAKEDGDIGKSIDILVNSALTAFDNIEPKIERALGGMSQFVEKAAPLIADKLPPIIEKIAPSLLSSSAAVIGAVAKGVLAATPAFLDSAIDIMAQVNKALRDNGESGGFLQTIADDITARIPTVFRFGRRILEAIIDDLQNVDYGALAEGLQKVFHSAISNITDLVSGLDVDKAAQNISNFINRIDWMKILDDLGKLLGETVKKLPEFLDGLVNNLDYTQASMAIAVLFTPKILGSLVTKLSEAGAFSGIHSALAKGFGSGADGAAGLFFGNFTACLEAFALGWNIGTFIRNLIGEEKIDQWVEGIFNSLNIAANIVKGKLDQSIRDSANSRNDAYNTGGNHRAHGAYFKSPGYDRFGDLYGEGGGEVALPLDSTDEWANKLAHAIAREGSTGMVVQNLNLSVEGGRIADDYDTDRFIERVAEKLGALSVRQSRAVGGTGWNY